MFKNRMVYFCGLGLLVALRSQQYFQVILWLTCMKGSVIGITEGVSSTDCYNNLTRFL
jgi:hypothetical protein